MKIIIFIIFSFTAYFINAHELEISDSNLLDQTTIEIINERMKKMSIINKLSQQIYKQLNLEDFKKIKDNTIELKNTAIDFRQLFPENSNGGKAKELIWEDKVLFEEYIDNFINDIDLMINNINEKNTKQLLESFKIMTSNCSSCHKKFKNK